MIDSDDRVTILWILAIVVGIVVAAALLGFSIGLGVRMFHVGAGG